MGSHGNSEAGSGAGGTGAGGQYNLEYTEGVVTTVELDVVLGEDERTEVFSELVIEVVEAAMTSTESLR